MPTFDQFRQDYELANHLLAQADAKHKMPGGKIDALALYEQSIALYQRVESIAAQVLPQALYTRVMPTVWHNQGLMFRSLERYQEAKHCYERALQIQADYAPSLHNLSLLNLSLGLFNDEQSWRVWCANPVFAAQQIKIPFAQWSGVDSLAGKTLLLTNAMGFGDAIFFSRYIPLLQARGATIILHLQPSLQRLLADGMRVECLSHADALTHRSDIDFYFPMHQLPLVLQTKLGIVPLPALNRVHTVHTHQPLRAKRRIGLVWSGGWIADIEMTRSMALKELMPLFDNEQVEWYSLQDSVLSSDQETMNELITAGRLKVLPPFVDFADTAQAMLQLYAVVSIDTACAHLAASLGVPTWIMLKYDADWRWMLGKEQTSWYQSARLFRQQQPDDWTSVVQTVQAALCEPTVA